MTHVEMAENILNSDMDINLKKLEIGKIRNQAYSNKFMMTGLSVFCVVFGITIFPLFLLPFTLTAAKAHKKQLIELDNMLFNLNFNS